MNSVVSLLLAALIAGSAAIPCHADEQFDLVLQNARIVDGTGSPWYTGDVAVRDGRIVRIGRIPNADAEQTLDVAGLYLVPGFVDMMGQTAEPFLEDPETARNLLRQGITTINAGEGHSAAPLNDRDAGRAGWRTLNEYFQLLEMKGLPLNVAQTVGHTQVRRLVLGESDRQPTEEEMQRMEDLVRRAMEDGAIGLSTALIYPPAVYAETEEIARLAQVAGEYGGRYYTHMRNEGDRLLEAIEEALEIGRRAGTPVHIFHLKAAGQQNWAKIDQAIARIKAARAEGQEVTADIYPYINNGLGLASFIHPRHFAEGDEHLRQQLANPKVRAEIRREMESEEGWENWYRHVGGDWSKVVLGSIEAEKYSQYAGRSLAEIAEATETDPWTVFFEIAAEGAFALPQSMTEANKIKLMQQPFISFCTDAGPAGGSAITSHPRAYGAFPRLLSRYVRDLGALPLERAVAQAGALASNDLMAYDRGRIAVGQAADLVVIDLERIADRATFARPDRLADGVKHVIVNGELVLKNGELTGRRPGRVLRGPGYRDETASWNVSTGKNDPRMAPFDRLMRRFMKKHRIPGAALAVTDGGRLVHARGYGYADLAEREKVTPQSRFRIASLSKPITAVAVLQLVERGKLSLDDRVLDVLKFDPELTNGDGFDGRQREVTIRHLLHHTGGWDRDESFDPMFRAVRIAEALDVEPPAGPKHVIRYMLGQSLDFDPGTEYAYSNYGYCLLGRVIEKVSGQPYETYVREHVLEPLGIESMRIGGTRLDDRQPGEVKYYDPAKGSSVFAEALGESVPHAYGAWHLEAMDSHGAWIASAVDLARFAVAFDDPENCPILGPESLRTMFDRPPGAPGRDGNGEPKDVYYACGWFVRPVGEGTLNAWHTGSLPGTAALLVRRHDGRNWIVLFNARESRHAGHFGRAIDPQLHKAADAVNQWPRDDLFSAW